MNERRRQRRNAAGRRRLALASLAGALLTAAAADAADRIVISIPRVPADGLVVARVDLAEAAAWCGVTVAPERLRASAADGAATAPAQFVPDEGRPAAGVFIARCPPSATAVNLLLDFSGPPAAAPATSTTVRTPWYTVVHDPGRMGGLPAELQFAGADGKRVPLLWNDRLYQRQEGQFWLRHAPRPRVQGVASGPLCTVVRVVAGYVQPDGRRPASQPAAVYDWFYFHDQPLIHVRGTARQATPYAWHETHFLELVCPTNAWPRWAGGEPRAEGAFRGSDESRRFAGWAGVHDGRHAIGLFQSGAVLLYDGRGYGPYLHAQGDSAWRGWQTTETTQTAWLRVAADDDPVAALAGAAAARTDESTVTVSSERLRERIAAVRGRHAAARGENRAAPGGQLVLAQLLERQGRFREALAGAAGATPPTWHIVPAGDLRLILEERTDGVALMGLADAAAGALLTDADNPPLFELTLRDGTTNSVRLSAEQGWGRVAIERHAGEPPLTVRWREPRAKGPGALCVTARARADAARHALAWTFEVDGVSAPWSLWQVRFPQLALSVGGRESQLLLPQAAGVLRPVGREPLALFLGEYPNGWLTMQLAALYDPAAGTGLYCGLHDPQGSTKQLTADQAGPARAVRLAWDIPAPDQGRAGNRFEQSGTVVWQLLRGDWYDAALVYRDWAQREAQWFPPLTADGRADTPPWMRELGAWAQMGGPPATCVPAVLAFAESLGVPVGFHWYNWHQIPFDNDYPHYFPAKDGFVEGVRQLQAGGVHVMPYINGRLWDTRDGGTNDVAFTREALPATTKEAGGAPCIETYGSREADGTPVRLAVMCPTTRLWQGRLHDIVLQLFNACGVQAVYIDQVAAARPILCHDAAHGHPLGGGSWWRTQGYGPLLERIRRDKPPERALTTECNAEPYLRGFDGYLTWHWQHDGQVPLFPAVYGGAIQMFGRAYGGGPTRDLALRMKAAQQLTWGEQLGWLDPGLVREPANFAFFREAVRLRWQLRRYFHTGRMARPPALAADLPKVTADWQWSGAWPVTTPAVLTGAWQLPAERRVVLLFANVSDEAITAPVCYDLREAGLTGATCRRSRWTAAGATPLADTSPTLRETVTFPPHGVWAWEFGP